MENTAMVRLPAVVSALLSVAGLVPLAAADSAPAPAPAAGTPRVVDCDAPVPSRKRGVCANKLDDADFRALAPGVTWWYNWFFKPSSVPSAGVAIDFLPMVWGEDPTQLAGFEQYLASGAKPKHVLAINEPNLKGQAFITPQATAALFARIKTVADAHGIDVVGPNMSLGSAPKDSITAADPLEGKEVTYTFMNPFIKAFLHFSDKTPVASLGVHSYGNIHELRWLVDMMQKEFKRPVWVTEYAQWKTANSAAALEYLVQATDLLEASPGIAGYAWFKERSDNSGISLFDAQPGKLTRLGEAYVAMPVHDPDLWYRIPGTLQAERYTTEHEADIRPTADTAGFLDLVGNGKDTSATYQVQVERAGSFAITLRINGVKDGTVTIADGTTTLATLPVATAGWQELTTTVTLPAGARSLTVGFAKKGLALNWIRFAAQ